MILLRSLAFNLYYFGLTAGLALWGLLFASRTPARAFAIGRLWARLALAGARVLCGIRIEISGREHLPTGGGALIASQHQSALDTMVWFLLVPKVAYVLKRELTRVPLFGAMTMRAGMIPVDRDGGASALRALLRATDRALADGRQVVIFPEGTRAEPGSHPPLQPGIAALAARTGLPVIPVRTDSGHCWGRRAFRKLPGTVHMRVEPPLARTSTRAALMQSLQHAFEQ